MAKSPVHPRRRRFIKLTATGLVDSAYGTCSVLENKLVAAKGWCTAWSG